MELHRGKEVAHAIARIRLANGGEVRARLLETSGERLGIGGRHLQAADIRGYHNGIRELFRAQVADDHRRREKVVHWNVEKSRDLLRVQRGEEVLQVVMYATEFTLAYVDGKLEEHHLTDAVELVEIRPKEKFTIGPFTIEPIRVTHSLVDCVALAIHTPVGVVLHTGDFKID